MVATSWSISHNNWSVFRILWIAKYFQSSDLLFFFFSSRRRHTRFDCDWSSDVCSSDLAAKVLHRLASLDDLRKHALRVGEQSPTGIGQGHPPRATNEEVDPEIAFEALKPRRQCGLSEVQDLGRPAHVAEPRRLRKCLQLR